VLLQIVSNLYNTVGFCHAMNYDAVLSQITPSNTERERLQTSTNLFLRKLQVDAEVIVGGSMAKDTWLSNNNEVDIFVRFTDDTDISDTLEKVLRTQFTSVTRVHGSRDYFHVVFEEILFEVVPILKIDVADNAHNITDVSPLHAEWVNKECKRKQDVRLLKQFCKAQRVYGAESYISGFSGYITEILVTHYGSFEAVLRAAITWKHQEIIDPSAYYKNKHVWFEVNHSKLVSPIIIIDPVDKNRNAAAALSKQQCHRFVTAAKQFLKQPSETFFVYQSPKYNMQNVVTIKFEPLSGKKDIVGAQLVKTYHKIVEQLHDYGVKKHDWEWTDAFYVYLECERTLLPSTYEHRGPPVVHEKHAELFKQQYPKAYEKEGVLYCTRERENITIKQSIEHILNNTWEFPKWTTFTLQ